MLKTGKVLGRKWPVLQNESKLVAQVSCSGYTSVIMLALFHFRPSWTLRALDTLVQYLIQYLAYVWTNLSCDTWHVPQIMPAIRVGGFWMLQNEEINTEYEYYIRKVSVNRQFPLRVGVSYEYPNLRPKFQILIRSSPWNSIFSHNVHCTALKKYQSCGDNKLVE